MIVKILKVSTLIICRDKTMRMLQVHNCLTGIDHARERKG